MNEFLPSEVARLVLGYLKETRCKKSYKVFLNESQYLGECRELIRMGRDCRTTIGRDTLLMILKEYCRLSALNVNVASPCHKVNIDSSAEESSQDEENNEKRSNNAKKLGRNSHQISSVQTTKKTFSNNNNNNTDQSINAAVYSDNTVNEQTSRNSDMNSSLGSVTSLRITEEKCIQVDPDLVNLGNLRKNVQAQKESQRTPEILSVPNSVDATESGQMNETLSTENIQTDSLLKKTGTGKRTPEESENASMVPFEFQQNMQKTSQNINTTANSSTQEDISMDTNENAPLTIQNEIQKSQTTNTDSNSKTANSLSETLDRNPSNLQCPETSTNVINKNSAIRNSEVRSSSSPLNRAIIDQEHCSASKIAKDSYGNNSASTFNLQPSSTTKPAKSSPQISNVIENYDNLPVTPENLCSPSPYKRCPSVSSPRYYLSLEKTIEPSLSTPMKSLRQLREAELKSPKRKSIIPRRRLIPDASPLAKHNLSASDNNQSEDTSNTHNAVPTIDGNLLSNDLLNFPEFVAKLAENINIVKNSDISDKETIEQPVENETASTAEELQLADDVIRNILVRTEAEPIFEEYLSYLSGRCDSTTDNFDNCSFSDLTFLSPFRPYNTLNTPKSLMKFNGNIRSSASNLSELIRNMSPELNTNVSEGPRPISEAADQTTIVNFQTSSVNTSEVHSHCESSAIEQQNFAVERTIEMENISEPVTEIQELNLRNLDITYKSNVEEPNNMQNQQLQTEIHNSEKDIETSAKITSQITNDLHSSSNSTLKSVIEVSANVISNISSNIYEKSPFENNTVVVDSIRQPIFNLGVGSGPQNSVTHSLGENGMSQVNNVMYLIQNNSLKTNLQTQLPANVVLSSGDTNSPQPLWILDGDILKYNSNLSNISSLQANANMGTTFFLNNTSNMGSNVLAFNNSIGHQPIMTVFTNETTSCMDKAPKNTGKRRRRLTKPKEKSKLNASYYAQKKKETLVQYSPSCGLNVMYNAENDKMIKEIVKKNARNRKSLNLRHKTLEANKTEEIVCISSANGTTFRLSERELLASQPELIALTGQEPGKLTPLSTISPSKFSELMSSLPIGLSPAEALGNIGSKIQTKAVPSSPVNNLVQNEVINAQNIHLQSSNDDFSQSDPLHTSTPKLYRPTSIQRKKTNEKASFNCNKTNVSDAKSPKENSTQLLALISSAKNMFKPKRLQNAHVRTLDFGPGSKQTSIDVSSENERESNVQILECHTVQSKDHNGNEKSDNLAENVVTFNFESNGSNPSPSKEQMCRMVTRSILDFFKNTRPNETVPEDVQKKVPHQTVQNQQVLDTNSNACSSPAKIVDAELAFLNRNQFGNAEQNEEGLSLLSKICDEAEKLCEEEKEAKINAEKDKLPNVEVNTHDLVVTSFTGMVNKLSDNMKDSTEIDKVTSPLNTNDGTVRKRKNSRKQKLEERCTMPVKDFQKSNLNADQKHSKSSVKSRNLSSKYQNDKHNVADSAIESTLEMREDDKNCSKSQSKKSNSFDDSCKRNANVEQCSKRSSRTNLVRNSSQTNSTKSSENCLTWDLPSPKRKKKAIETNTLSPGVKLPRNWDQSEISSYNAICKTKLTKNSILSSRKKSSGSERQKKATMSPNEPAKAKDIRHQGKKYSKTKNVQSDRKITRTSKDKRTESPKIKIPLPKDRIKAAERELTKDRIKASAREFRNSSPNSKRRNNSDTGTREKTKSSPRCKKRKIENTEIDDIQYNGLKSSVLSFNSAFSSSNSSISSYSTTPVKNYGQLEQKNNDHLATGSKNETNSKLALNDVFSRMKYLTNSEIEKKLNSLSKSNVNKGYF